MRYGITISPVGPTGDPRGMMELAVLAEQAGWDAMFLEDYVAYPDPPPTYDPWIVMAGMAVVTSRIRIGTLVTPVTRRRPWKLAMEAATLDHLSGGRVILGAGAGDAAETSFAAAGEVSSQRELAERLDEALELIAELCRGGPVSFEGRHYRTRELELRPRPLQQPRIPIWVGGDWLRPGVRRRLPRWDGTCAYHGTPGTEESRPLDAGEVADLLAWVRESRGNVDGFDVCVGGREREPDADREREYLASLKAAGATWWQEWCRPGDAARTRDAVARGPLRV